MLTCCKTVKKEKTTKPKNRPKWAGPAFLTTFVVGCLCAAIWFFFASLDHFLGEENTFGEITIKPYGYDRTALLNQHWDSIIVSGPNFHVKTVNPGFKFSRSDSLFFKVAASDVDIKLTPAKDSAENPIDIPEIPDMSLIFRIGVQVDHLSIDVANAGKWEASDINIYNPSRKNLKLNANTISGTHIDKQLSFSAEANWDESSINLDTKTITGKDTVALAASAPRKKVTDAQINTEIQLANPKDFIKDYPDAAPSISNLKVKAKLTNSEEKSIRYKATIEADMGERWPLPPMHATIKANGDLNSAQFSIVTESESGGRIELQGTGTKNLEGEVRGFVQNISAEFGPQIMPLDLTIHSAIKSGNTIVARTTTGTGSHVNATIQLSPFRIDYTGDLAPNEPWAVQWSGGELKFGSRPQVIGEFSDGEMRTGVRIGKLPYCYLMAADSMYTHLILNSNGIHFDKGNIYGKHESFTFTGEVMWNDVEPHTSWEVIASDGGNARARVVFEGPSIEADAQGVLLSTIPFAKRYLPEWMDARVTGTYSHDFDIDSAEAKFSAEADLQMFHTLGDFKVKKLQDTVVLESATVNHEQNKIELQASIVLPGEEAVTGALPVEVLNAWISTRSFSIPLSLLPLNDSTFTNGEFSGDLSFTDSHGFHGNIEFSNIEFRDIPKDFFAIKQMNFFAERAKAELDADLELMNGIWDGHTQITFDQILGAQKHFSFVHITNNGGNILGSGYLDSTIIANVKMDGNWLLPAGAGELRKSDLSVGLSWELARGLNGLKAEFAADSVVYAPLTIDYEVPVKLKGKIEDKTIFVTEAVSQNSSGDSITANLSYAFDKMILQQLNLHTDSYAVEFGEHKATFKGINATLVEKEDELSIDATIPEVLYNYSSEGIGNVDARAHGDLHYHLPKQKSMDLRLANMIDGGVIVDKLIYKKNIDIEITPRTVTQLLNSLQNTLASLRRKNEVAKPEITKTNSTSLNIHVTNATEDSIYIDASFAKFPFAINLDVQGTASRPTLRGEVANAGEGFVGFKGLYEFNVQSFLISWAGVPWQQGILDISISQDLPYCTESEDHQQNETCPVNIDINGTITNPQPTPNSYCGTETTPAAIYYNIFLGCITEDPTGESVDWNKLAGTAIGKVISTTANKTLGGNYIGNIDMKMRIFSNTETLEEDSSYVKIPISLDKWVNNLSIVLGYTQDQSENPTYEQAFEFGINYKLPVFQEAEYSHSDHLNPELSVGAMLVSKQYHVNSATQEDENQLEKNIGITYRYKFWSPCLLGLGKCKDYTEKVEPKESETKK